MPSRALLFYSKESFSDANLLKSRLRENGINVIDVRTGKYIEIDIIDEPRKVIKLLGEPLFIVTEINGNFKELFYEMRFWECHEILEEKWKKLENKLERDYLQALILICASLIKYLKGDVKTSDILIEKALSLISDLPQELLPLLYVRFGLNS
ncbi:DUF309 domain-containing protein [Saccharolobus caldissimus]|uniref:DUF309 domain-containing protein n=1 Tax=Saccharolobus caldissimus TaxID=1702097 RepID=A0AAQ4CND1_9CREN|nr:DUF309 domain-containing protein [Saccharolobus caldissimus]BDB97312.1 hypothetical protein SACC_03290 [Saccharolobus caldissimus]